MNEAAADYAERRSKPCFLTPRERILYRQDRIITGSYCHDRRGHSEHQELLVEHIDSHTEVSLQMINAYCLYT